MLSAKAAKPCLVLPCLARAQCTGSPSGNKIFRNNPPQAERSNSRLRWLRKSATQGVQRASFSVSFFSQFRRQNVPRHASSENAPLVQASSSCLPWWPRRPFSGLVSWGHSWKSSGAISVALRDANREAYIIEPSRTAAPALLHYSGAIGTKMVCLRHCAWTLAGLAAHVPPAMVERGGHIFDMARQAFYQGGGMALQGHAILYLARLPLYTARRSSPLAHKELD